MQSSTGPDMPLWAVLTVCGIVLAFAIVGGLTALDWLGALELRGC